MILGADPERLQRRHPPAKRELHDDIEGSGSGGCLTGSKGRKHSLEKPRRKFFACPWSKYSLRYVKLQSCYTREWESVARVKEHVQRAHRAPPYCIRCYEIFTTNAQLDSHLLNEKTCEIISKPSGFGQTWLPEEALPRVCSRKPRGQSEEEAWETLYKLCFKNAKVIPSPYFEHIPQPHWVPATASAIEHLSHAIVESLIKPHTLKRRYESMSTPEELESLEKVVRKCIRDVTSTCATHNVEKDIQRAPSGFDSTSWLVEEPSRSQDFGPSSPVRDPDAFLLCDYATSEMQAFAPHLERFPELAHRAEPDRDSTYGSEMGSVFNSELLGHQKSIQTHSISTSESNVFGIFDDLFSARWGACGWADSLDFVGAAGFDYNEAAKSDLIYQTATI